MRAGVITSVGSICHLIHRVVNLEMFKINNTTVRISMGKYLYSLLVLYLSDGRVVVCDIPKQFGQSATIGLVGLRTVELVYGTGP